MCSSKQQTSTLFHAAEPILKLVRNILFKRLKMLSLFGIFFIVISWASGLMDWVVFLATSLVQAGVWVTVRALLPVWSLWLGLKTSNTESMGPTPLQTHLKSQLRI